MAILVASGANVLILDEPTNHLDLESRGAGGCLRAFDGALLLVSHDRGLLDAVGARTIAIEEGRLHSYPGGWTTWACVTSAGPPQARRRERPITRLDGRRRAGQAARPAVSKNTKQRITVLERAVEEAEAALTGSRTSLPTPHVG